MKDYPYMFRYGQNLYYVSLDNNNQVKAAWRTDLDGGNREFVNAPQVQMLIDQKNIKLTKRNTGGTNATNTQPNTNTPNTNTTQGTGESAGRLMTLDDFCYKAGINQKVNTDELKKYLKSPDIKTDANHWKQFFNNPKIQELFTNNPGVMDAVNSYDDEFDAKNYPDKSQNVEVEKLSPAKDFNEVVERINSMAENSGQHIGNRAQGKPTAGVVNDRQYSLQSLITDSTSLLNGTTNLQQIVSNAWNNTKNTIKTARPKDYPTIERTMNILLQPGGTTQLGSIRYCFGIIQQVLPTSRNEMPVTKGFQNMLNLFGIKDDRGQAFVPDGKIGPKTSKALSDADFKDIYAVKEAVKQFQTNHNVPPQPDGIAGKNTIAALRQAGINSFDALKRDNQKYHIQNRNAQNPAMANMSGKIPGKVASQMNAVPNTNTQTQGIGRRTLSETDLRNIITKAILNELKKKI